MLECGSLGDIITPRLQTFNEAGTIIQDICSKEDKMVAGRVVVMLWVLWNNRNNWLCNDKKEKANNLGMQAFNSWMDSFMAQNFQLDNDNDQQSQQ